MSSRIRHTLLGTALVLLAVLVVVPAAAARHSAPPSPSMAARGAVPRSTCHQYCGARHGLSPWSRPVIVKTEIVPSAGKGFQWLDAALGFGVACSLVLLAAGALAARRRVRVTPIASGS